MNGRAKGRHWVRVRLCSGTMWSVFPAAPVLFQHSGKWAAAVLQNLQVYEIICLGCFILESVGRCPAVIMLRSTGPAATVSGTEACGAAWLWQ